jgi:hypothetical protein
MQVLCNGPAGFTQLNEHIEADGPTVFAHSCKMAWRALYRSGRARPIAPGGRAIG